MIIFTDFYSRYNTFKCGRRHQLAIFIRITYWWYHRTSWNYYWTCMQRHGMYVKSCLSPITQEFREYAHDLLSYFRCQFSAFRCPLSAVRCLLSTVYAMLPSKLSSRPLDGTKIVTDNDVNYNVVCCAKSSVSVFFKISTVSGVFDRAQDRHIISRKNYNRSLCPSFYYR